MLLFIDAMKLPVKLVGSDLGYIQGLRLNRGVRRKSHMKIEIDSNRYHKRSTKNTESKQYSFGNDIINSRMVKNLA